MRQIRVGMQGMRVGMHEIGVGKTNVLLQNCYKSIGEVQKK